MYLTKSPQPAQAAAIHGDITQAQRTKAVEQFKAGQVADMPHAAGQPGFFTTRNTDHCTLLAHVLRCRVGLHCCAPHVSPAQALSSQLVEPCNVFYQGYV